MFKSRYFLTFSLLLLSFLSVFAQMDHVFVYGNMKLEKGKLEGTMEVLENGKRVKILKVTGRGKFEHKADLNKNYIYSFSQDGYVTKKIALDTRVPERPEDAYLLQFTFQVTLFKQYEGINFVVFNQPVAKAGYNAVIDDIEYDTDYTKSIHEQIEMVQEQVAEAEKEEEKQAKNKSKEEKKSPPSPPDAKKEEEKPPPKAVITEELSVKKEDPPTQRRRYSPPPPPPPKKNFERTVVLHSYTVGEMGFPNLNAYGFINFGDGGGRREISKEQFDEYAKTYHHTGE